MRADYHLINQLAEYLVFILNGYSYLMIINNTKLSLLEICIYPTILCLLLGNIIFWVLETIILCFPIADNSVLVSSK